MIPLFEANTFPTISILDDSTSESIRSSISLVILSDTKIELATVPSIIEPTEAPPSPDYHVGADTESDPFEAEFEEDPSGDDSFEIGPSEAAKPLPAQVVPSPPL
ncbi:hypothetical protein Tco_0253378, partial [Tanacetum coccineum]